ncbi:MAG: nuclear transport factor 2 family protein [Chthoniobacterales bacterium]
MSEHPPPGGVRSVGMSEKQGEQGMTERFKKSLQKSEEARDPQAVASLFAQGAELSNLGGDHGTDATAFWKIYLDQFGEIRSEFTSETVGDKTAALEWKSRGTTAAGKPIEYSGISVIEFNEQKVTGFRTYYDSAAFVGAEATTA